MKRTPEQEQIYREERRIGKEAAKMASRHLQQILKQKLNIHNIGFPEEPILEATDVKVAMGDYRFLGLNLMSSKTGFILHHGFVGVREATTVYLKASRYNKNKTQRKRHEFSLPAQKIFENFYFTSGAVDYLIQELTRTRQKALQYDVNNLAIKFSNLDQEDGK